MKLGTLSRVIRSGMERARDQEVQSWVDAANSQDDAGRQKIYEQVATAVHAGISSAIEHGLESLLDDYNLVDGIIRSAPSSEPVKEISFDEQPAVKKKPRKRKARVEDPVSDEEKKADELPAETPRRQRSVRPVNPRTGSDGRRVHVI